MSDENDVEKYLKAQERWRDNTLLREMNGKSCGNLQQWTLDRGVSVQLHEVRLLKEALCRESLKFH